MIRTEIMVPIGAVVLQDLVNDEGEKDDDVAEQLKKMDVLKASLHGRIPDGRVLVHVACYRGCSGTMDCDVVHELEHRRIAEPISDLVNNSVLIHEKG